MPTFVSVMLRILDEYNIQYGTDIVKIITPLGYKGTAEYFKTLGVEASVEELLRKMNFYVQKEYEENIQAKSEVRETLIELKRRGNGLHILTASPHSILDICLKRLGLYDLFTNVWSCDDFRLSKANPDIYLKAAEKLGVESDEIIFLDDNFNALKAAKQAGLKIYGVFDPSSSEYVNDIKQQN